MIEAMEKTVGQTAADAVPQPAAPTNLVRINFEGVEVSVPMDIGGDRRAALRKAREALRRLAKKEAAPEQPMRRDCPNTFALWAYRS